MPRYIDADALDDIVQELNEHRDFGITRYEYKRISNIIFEFPTADVVEVVRCKDCKYNVDGEPNISGLVYCGEVLDGWISEDFFCKEGERREDA